MNVDDMGHGQGIYAPSKRREMGEFGWGKVFGILEMEDCQNDHVFRMDPIKLGKPRIKGKMNLGRVIEFDRDCSKCARHVKLQVGSDVVFLDGKPFLLEMPIGLDKGHVTVPIGFVLI